MTLKRRIYLTFKSFQKLESCEEIQNLSSISSKVGLLGQKKTVIWVNYSIRISSSSCSSSSCCCCCCPVTEVIPQVFEVIACKGGTEGSDLRPLSKWVNNFKYLW